MAQTLADRGHPKGTPARIALPVAGDDERFKRLALELVENAGFDAVDAGGLADSWRQQPGTPAYCTELTAEQLRFSLASANEARAPENRDSLLNLFLNSAAPLTYEDVIAMNRKGTAAEKTGAKVKSYTLNDLKYSGCQGCMACKTKTEKCILKDDLAEVLDAVQEADVLVLASPVYYGDISSQLKGFIDRTFSYLVPDFMTNPNPVRFAPGKKLVFALTQGQPENAFSDIFPRYDFFFKWYGFSESHLIRACGVVGPGEIDTCPNILAQAEDTARKVCSK